VIEGMASKKSHLKEQIERYILSYSDRDKRAHLSQLLKKSHDSQQRGFFFDELVALHFVTAASDAETLNRCAAFPLRLRPLVNEDATVRLLDLAFTVTTGAPYRMLATSHHREVEAFRRSLFRIYSQHDVSQTDDCLRIAQSAHRLSACADEMEKRVRELKRTEPVVIDLVY
jgi:hypothetical protein